MKVLHHKYNILARESDWEEMAGIPGNDDIITPLPCKMVGFLSGDNTYGKYKKEDADDQITME